MVMLVGCGAVVVWLRFGALVCWVGGSSVGGSIGWGLSCVSEGMLFGAAVVGCMGDHGASK
eukprot:11310631-Prorocentrum_lima.AAC.1